MKLTCIPSEKALASVGGNVLPVLLFGRTTQPKIGSTGAAVREGVARQKLAPCSRAWDLVSIAMAVTAADLAALRSSSPDGWTREIELTIAVNDPDFWNTQKHLLESQLKFLTTDRWSISFLPEGHTFVAAKSPIFPKEDSIALLSGGLDSLVGALDLVDSGMKPFVVSQTVTGDKDKQADFASTIGGGLRHLQLNHATEIRGENERSQRARSLVFFAYGTMAATTLERYHQGDQVTLYVCENGLISVNAPLTDARLGSLSTRTTHPVFIAMLQSLLDAAGLRVRLVNPYQFKTKGEMLADCAAQEFLIANAHNTTSCGRYARYNFHHCGRCVPCLIRRAAFHKWGVKDRTKYVFKNLALNDSDHSGFDDVRSAAMAVAEVASNGVEAWLGSSLASSFVDDISPYCEVVERGIDELQSFLKKTRVR